MTELIKILVVEDNDDQWETYNDTAYELRSDDRTIELERKDSAEGAKDILLSSHFDGAIVDLNLTQGNPEEASGNDVLNAIIQSHRFPVLVVSGNLDHLDDDIKDKKSDFLQFFDRDTPNDDIFRHLLRIHTTGITKILGGRGKIEQLLGDVFWQHLSSDFDTWSQQNETSEKTLLRYSISHLSEYLDIPDGEGAYYHEAEVYIKPPIRSHIASGDIIEWEDKRYIVLSPSCDIAVRAINEGIPRINAERITLAPLIKVDSEEFIGRRIISGNDHINSRKKKLEKIIKGQQEKFGFLPKYSDIPPSVIDFQNIHTISFNEFRESADRVATVSGIFLKDIQSRFSAYLARQGQPDLNKTNLIEQYSALLQ